MNTLVACTPTVGALHLTQILVPYEDAIRQLHIRDAYDWHQRVWEAFGGRDGHARDFLIRVDRKDDGYRVHILSSAPPTRPDWCPAECFSTKIVPDAYFTYARYRFSLLANPTKKLRENNADGTRKKNGRRVPITQREDLITWLTRKADVGGFTINSEDLRTIPRGRMMFHKPGAHGSHTAIEFDGELTVTDPALFRGTVATGIGSAKAFGFGLLVIVPVA